MEITLSCVADGALLQEQPEASPEQLGVGLTQHGEPPVEPPEPVPAVMCVEVVRACGLLAAVNEAAIWLGGGEPQLHVTTAPPVAECITVCPDLSAQTCRTAISML